MWAGIGASVALFATLLAAGMRKGNALAAASGVLLLVCVATCVWSWVSAERGWKDALTELARLRPLRSRDQA